LFAKNILENIFLEFVVLKRQKKIIENIWRPEISIKRRLPNGLAFISFYMKNLGIGMKNRLRVDFLE
jgi:hypothetical protein